MGAFFTLAAIARGARCQQALGPQITFEYLEDEIIDSPFFSIAKSRQYYEASGRTNRDRPYNILMWRQRPDQVAGLIRIWRRFSESYIDDSFVVLDTAIKGDYGNFESYWAATTEFQKLGVLPRSVSAASEARYQSVSRSLKNPNSPVYDFNESSIEVVGTKATYQF